MKKLDVQLTRSPTKAIPVGQLAEVDHRIYFEYDARFFATMLNPSPFKLPVRPGLIEHADLGFGPLPGLFDDSLPDGWGLLLMNRHFRKQKIDPATLSPLDRLAYLGTRTMGALTYHPPTEAAIGDGEIDLFELGRNAEAILSGESAEVLPALMRAGGSPGGARPKVLVGVNDDHLVSGENDLPAGYEHWLIKFGGKSDAQDAGALEYAYHLMARAAGIDMPDARLFHAGRGRYFGVRRFDRSPGNRRVHVHTFGNLIQTNFRIPSCDYSDLLKATSVLTRDRREVLEVFRRMIFNIAAHNRDDHAKNFAFIMNETGEWRLSPAYDLTFAAGPGGEHTMTIAGEGQRPTREHCQQLAQQFGLKLREIELVFSDVNDAVARWTKFADQASCSKHTAAKVSFYFID